MPAMYQFSPSPCRPDWRIAMQQLPVRFDAPCQICAHCKAPIVDPKPDKVFCSMSCKNQDKTQKRKAADALKRLAIRKATKTKGKT